MLQSIPAEEPVLVLPIFSKLFCRRGTGLCSGATPVNWTQIDDCEGYIYLHPVINSVPRSSCNLWEKLATEPDCNQFGPNRSCRSKGLHDRSGCSCGGSSRYKRPVATGCNRSTIRKNCLCHRCNRLRVSTIYVTSAA